MNNKVKDALILGAAYELLQNPENIVADRYAEDAYGYITEPVNPQACKWCVMGAIRAFNVFSGGHGYFNASSALERFMPFRNVVAKFDEDPGFVLSKIPEAITFIMNEETDKFAKEEIQVILLKLGK